jgi:hypothetical protein
VNGDHPEPGYHVRLTDEAYAGWKTAAEEEGMTTAGLLEMVGRQLAVKRSAARRHARVGDTTSRR